MTTQFATITCETHDRVATITLNRPERKNAIGPQMTNELLHALDQAKDDADARVVVLTGAGGVFCAGGDLKQMSGSAEVELEFKGDYADLLLRFRTLGKPTIAKIPGLALGGGLGLVACCDFAVAAESAILGTPEIKRGLFPMMITAVLAPLVPRRQLVAMMLLGDKLSAVEAKDAGLLTQVVPDAALDRTVTELAARLAEQSPTAMRMGLIAMHRQVDMPDAEALPYLRDQLYALLGTDDAQEGLMAFMQKRQPVWKGR